MRALKRKEEVECLHKQQGAALPLQLLANLLHEEVHDNPIVVPYDGHLHVAVVSVGSQPEWQVVGI